MWLGRSNTLVMTRTRAYTVAAILLIVFNTWMMMVMMVFGVSIFSCTCKCAGFFDYVCNYPSRPYAAFARSFCRFDYRTYNKNFGLINFFQCFFFMQQNFFFKIYSKKNKYLLIKNCFLISNTILEFSI